MVRGIANSKIGFGDLILLLRYFFKLKVSTHPNLLHVKLFGEMEFWLAIIKVVAIIAMIAFGSYLLASGSGHSQSSLQNLWQLGGFFPNGITGLVMAMAMIMFAFGGIELVGIAAAETDNPQKTLPKAVNQIVNH